MIHLAAATLVAALTAAPRVENAWSRPAASMGVTYATIVNPGDRPVRVVGASSPVARTVQLHESMAMGGGSMHGMQMGAMGMKEVSAIVVPAHGSVTLRPGGYHVMLIGLRRALRVGERFPVTFRFANGTATTTQVHVENRAM